MYFPGDITLLLALIMTGILCFMSLILFQRRGKLPPGPTPLPLLGNILQLRGESLVTKLAKMRSTYGDVFTIYLGSRTVVVVNGYKLVKEVYVDRADDFLARGDIAVFEDAYHNYGLGTTNDINRWKELRRFSLSVMRDFGMGKKSIEDVIVQEMQCLVDKLKKSKGECLDPQQIFSKVSGNVIFAIMFGHRHDYEDVELHGIINTMLETFHIISSGWGQIREMFPRMMHFIPGKHQTISSNMQKLLQYVRKRVENNKETLDPNNPRDYVDAFLIKMEKEKNNPQTEFTCINLVTSTLQIFFAGMETTSTTITYAILILMKNPDVLRKVYEEIDRVIGRERGPKMQDRNQLPYTDAVIHEMQRFIDLIPMGVPRKTTRDLEFRGYYIPKGPPCGVEYSEHYPSVLIYVGTNDRIHGRWRLLKNQVNELVCKLKGRTSKHTNVYPMLTTVLKDPACFPYPDEFNPKNFLDENGGFKNNDGFMPLATGKRNCLGEALFRMEYFLLVVTILQNFDLKPELPIKDLDITPDVSGFGNLPKPYKLAFIPR